MKTPAVSPASQPPQIALQADAGANLILALQACAVLAVAEAAGTVVATGVKVTSKAVGAVANAVIPD